MHSSIALIFFLLCFKSLCGQINKGRKLLETSNYEAALEAFENDLEKPANKPVSLYEIARIYQDPKFKDYNLDKAYLFTNRSIKEFNALSSAPKRQTQKKGVNLPVLKKQQQDIVRIALKYYQTKNTIEDLQHFVDYYKLANQQQLEQAYRQRNQLLTEQATRLNTFAQYQLVWKHYQKNMERYNPKEIQKIERSLLESYITEKGWAMYPHFEELYPENIYVLNKDAAYDYLKIRHKKDLNTFKKFIASYPDSPFKKFAKDQLLLLTLESNHLPDYDEFIRTYPSHKEINKLWKKFYLLYTANKKRSTILNFATAYPNYPFQETLQEDLATAQTNIEKPLYENIVQTEDIVSIMNFVQQFPNSTYIPSLENTFYKALEKRPLLRGSKYFITHYPNSSHYDAVLELYYKEYVKDGELGTLNQFMMEHPEYKNLAQQEIDLKIAEQGAKLDLSKMPTNDNKALYEAYILAAAPKERAFVALQRLLEPAIRQKRWKKAQQIIAQFEKAFKANPTKIQQLKNTLVSPISTSIVLPSSINSDQSERVVNIYSQDMVFARKNALYQTSKKGTTWTAPILLPTINEGIKGNYYSTTADGKELIYSHEGNLYHRLLKEGIWSSPIKLPQAINRSERELDVQLTTDGQTLLYSSESDQVLEWKTTIVAKNFHGTERSNSDLFVVTKDKEGKWKQPINLGDQINSPFAERHPFLHPDGKTLYFSSEGHGGLGKLDLYYSHRLDDTWQHWSIPVNLGTAINSAEDEGPCAVSKDHKTIYFTRKSEEGSKIYQCTIYLPKQ